MASVVESVLLGGVESGREVVRGADPARPVGDNGGRMEPAGGSPCAMPAAEKHPAQPVWGMLIGNRADRWGRLKIRGVGFAAIGESGYYQ